jgi:hypothetical protein
MAETVVRIPEQHGAAFGLGAGSSSVSVRRQKQLTNMHLRSGELTALTKGKR